MTDTPQFEHKRARTRLYLISPLDVTGGFADRLARALDAAGDDKHGPAGAAGSQRGGELRPIGALAALHLAELRHHLAAGLDDMGSNGLALRLKAEPGSALAIGRNPEIADKTGAGRGHGPCLRRVYHFGKWTFDRVIRI